MGRTVGAGGDLERAFADGGELGALVAAKDWSATPLGPVAAWPQSLRAALSVCLLSWFSIVLWWGPELRMFYNDAYQPILGGEASGGVGPAGTCHVARDLGRDRADA